MSKKFKVGEIAVDENGTFWLMYIGDHPDQGGMTYRWGSLGMVDAEALGTVVSIVMARETPEYMKRIKEKVSTVSKPDKI